MTGTVDDVRPYIAEAAVYVVPLRAGGGTRLKIFEALAMGKAVVSTTVGAEGLPLDAGRALSAPPTPGDFAGAVVGCCATRRRRRLGAAGRASSRPLLVEGGGSAPSRRCSRSSGAESGEHKSGKMPAGTTAPRGGAIGMDHL